MSFPAQPQESTWIDNLKYLTYPNLCIGLYHLDCIGLWIHMLRSGTSLVLSGTISPATPAWRKLRPELLYIGGAATSGKSWNSFQIWSEKLRPKRKKGTRFQMFTAGILQVVALWCFMMFHEFSANSFGCRKHLMATKLHHITEGALTPSGEHFFWAGLHR